MGSAPAQTDSELWHWYWVGPPHLRPADATFLRFGTARVAIGEGKVRIDFTAGDDVAHPNPTFEGRVAKDGAVEGELNGFSYQGPELWVGHYRGEDVEEEGCHYDEIMLRSGFPDGSVLMVSRLTKPCLSNSEDPL